MRKTFVVVDDWCHKLLRDLTRRTPIVATRLDNGLDRVLYQVRPELLPESYFSLVACHTLDGLPLEQLRLGCWRVRRTCKPAVLAAGGGFDATRLDRRCWGDLRLKPPGGGSALLAAELLAFGTGMLRGSGLSGRHGTLTADHQTVFARIWSLRREGSPGLTRVCKRVYESTNVIYGDAFGELEQLWDRRADVAFLDRVARVLGEVRHWGRLPVSPHPPLNAAEVMKVHRRSQAVWKAPPNSGRALLRRIEFILEHTTVDRPARRRLALPARPRFGNPASPAPRWRRDISGYDGWLPGSGTALN
ncbi:MAG TPA: hypothetical protein VJA21_06490 [Verrucomicrobiae bacterium]